MTGKEYECEKCGDLFMQVDDCQFFCDTCFEEITREEEAI